jgi:excisionase family DNA binding protein
MALRKYASIAEIAEAYDISTKTVRRRIADGSLPARRLGRLIRIDVEAAENLLRPVPTARPGGDAA